MGHHLCLERRGASVPLRRAAFKAVRPRLDNAAVVRLCVVGLVALAVAGPAAAATPDTQLAQKYAPVVRLATDVRGCEDATPLVPSNVNVILPNDEVVLRGPWDRTNIVKIAPTAEDLSRGLFDYHLDFPGDPLNPGCTYVTWSKRLSAYGKPTVYAHVATEAADPGKLALQYWFFYVFNDFNNLHEGDWEMIQLNFDAPNADAALKTQPTEVGYSQHEGAERASWDSSKLEKVGTHPVVYPAAGSHANFYSSALFLGRSAEQGVGCDDTRGPYEQTSPAVVTIPEASADYLREYPWLGFQGRWGELQPAFYNGPTGPNMKFQWTEPLTWAAGWRARSYAVPTGGLGSSSATDFFCGAVARGSNLLTAIIRNPLPGVLALVAVILLLFFAAAQTSWRGGVALRLARRRAWGELITSAWRMYRSHFGVFVRIGLLFIPVGVVVSLVQWLLFHIVGFVPWVETAGESSVSVAGLALSVGLLFTIVALAFVQAATAYAMAAIDRGEPVRALEAYRKALPNVPVLFGWVLVAAVIVAILNLTLFAIPIAVWLVVRWSLLAQVIQLDEETRPRPLRRSSALVRGNWWRVALFTLVVAGGGLILGPFVGGLLLLATSAAFNVINLIAGVVYTVTMPFVAIATTYLYYDLKTRSVLKAREVVVAGPLPAEI
jgi:hypothetical protein